MRIAKGISQTELNKYAWRMGKQIESIPNETMDALSRYSWPGNIRDYRI
jgi:formate hydrogenlyase transcriptional activator